MCGVVFCPVGLHGVVLLVVGVVWVWLGKENLVRGEWGSGARAWAVGKGNTK